jgi:hypothetical protein
VNDGAVHLADLAFPLTFKLGPIVGLNPGSLPQPAKFAPRHLAASPVGEQFGHSRFERGVTHRSPQTLAVPHSRHEPPSRFQTR